MIGVLPQRAWHLFLLIGAWALVCLPNLGTPSLWDIDEGNNAAAAHEMLEASNPIVPTFNYQLRVDKPALLYWLQMAAYDTFGVNEFAARLPSALASLAAVLLTYELGRALFGAGVGLAAGLLLTSASLFCAAARFANPDALLDACVLLHLALFWHGYQRGRLHFISAGAVCGFGMLAKGPIGVALPTFIVGLFLLWQGQLRLLLNCRLILATLAFLVIAGPWYAWVGVETKGQWLSGFFVKHNLERVLHPLENHAGPFWYYFAVLPFGCAPWSSFFGLMGWNVAQDLHDTESTTARSATRFLLCWAVVGLVIFSIAQTKLPNYVLPIYPALAMLTARAIERWRHGQISPPAWLPRACLACFVLIGIGTSIGLLVASGLIPSRIPSPRLVPGLESLAIIGLVPVLGGVLCAWLAGRARHEAACNSLFGSCVLFTALLAAWGPPIVDRLKAPRTLMASLPADQLEREVRIGAFDYFQPSLVFYAQREVASLGSENSLRDFLAGPLPTYVFVSASAWERLQHEGMAREIARHHDLYDGHDVVLVTNR